MFCQSCGSKVYGEFCQKCGRRTNIKTQNINLNIGGQYYPNKTNTYAVVSFILACTSYIFGWFISAIIAIIVGNEAKKQMRATHEKGNGYVTVALVLSWINIGFWGLVAFVFMIPFL